MSTNPCALDLQHWRIKILIEFSIAQCVFGVSAVVGCCNMVGFW